MRPLYKGHLPASLSFTVAKVVGVGWVGAGTGQAGPVAVGVAQQRATVQMQIHSSEKQLELLRELAPHGQSDSAAFLSLVETASLRHGEICFAQAKLALQAGDP